jgi:hypothetical protein
MKRKEKINIVLQSLDGHLKKIIFYLSIGPSEAQTQFHNILTTLPKKYTQTNDPTLYRREGVIPFLKIPDEIRLKFTPVVPAYKSNEIHTRVEITGRIPKVTPWYFLATIILGVFAILFAIIHIVWGAFFFLFLALIPFSAFSIEAQGQLTRIMLDHERISSGKYKWMISQNYSH